MSETIRIDYIFERNSDTAKTTHPLSNCGELFLHAVEYPQLIKTISANDGTSPNGSTTNLIRVREDPVATFTDIVLPSGLPTKEQLLQQINEKIEEGFSLLTDVPFLESTGTSTAVWRNPTVNTWEIDFVNEATRQIIEGTQSAGVRVLPAGSVSEELLPDPTLGAKSIYLSPQNRPEFPVPANGKWLEGRVFFPPKEFPVDMCQSSALTFRANFSSIGAERKLTSPFTSAVTFFLHNKI